MTLSQPDQPLTALGLVLPIAMGLAIAAAGAVPWTMMARMNAEVRPDLPWAALATAAYLAVLLAWLNGLGPPGRWKAARHSLLRLHVGRPPDAGSAPLSVPIIVGAFVLLTAVWIAMRPAELPDLSGYPTTVHRFSVAIMGAAMSGIVEEAAFRGYMQRGLERFGIHRAILITSLVFVLLHAVHGLGAPALSCRGW